MHPAEIWFNHYETNISNINKINKCR